MKNLNPSTQTRTWLVCAFTAVNLVMGLISMLLASSGEMTLAALCLLLCVVADTLDGLLARKFNVSTTFGAQFDSLADMTSFTIASAVLGYYWLQPLSPHPVLLLGASALWALAGAIRLARFNVTPYNGQYFQGLPTTAVASILALSYLSLPNLPWQLGLGLFVVLALLMVSVFPYVKLNRITKTPKWLMALVGLAAILNWNVVITLIICVYVLSGPALWVQRKLFDI
jgi:CDP-diacylglycerol--serine O-phosphatidyltransferase